MKRIVEVAVLMLFSVSLFSIEPGNWQVGGSFQTEKSKRGEGTLRNLYFRPEVHRYFSSRLGAGLAFDYWNDLNESGTHSSGVNIVGTLIVFPGRYNPYIRTGPSMLKAWLKSDEWYSEMGWYSEVGSLFKLMDHVYLNPNYSYKMSAKHMYARNSNVAHIDYRFEIALSVVL